MKYKIIILFLFLLQCTAYYKKNAIDNSKRGYCGESIVNLQEYRTAQNNEQKLLGSAEKIKNITATGIVAISETLIYVSGGIVVATLVCSPIILIEAAAKENMNTSTRCYAEVAPRAIETVFQKGNYHFTKQMIDDLKKPHIIKFDELAEITRNNALCLISKNDTESLQKAKKLLESLTFNQNIWKNINAKEQEKILDLTKEINLLLENQKTSSVR